MNRKEWGQSELTPFVFSADGGRHGGSVFQVDGVSSVYCMAKGKT